MWAIARSMFEAAFETAFEAARERSKGDPMFAIRTVQVAYSSPQFTGVSDAYQTAENQLRAAAPVEWAVFAMADAEWADPEALAALEVELRRAAPAEYATWIAAGEAYAAAEDDLRETAPAEWTVFRAIQAERRIQQAEWRLLREAAWMRVREAAPVEWAAWRAARKAVREKDAGADAVHDAAWDRFREAAPAEWEAFSKLDSLPPLDRRAVTAVQALTEAAPTAMARRSTASTLSFEVAKWLREAAPAEWAVFEAAREAWSRAAR